MDRLALILSVLGGINWGLVGLFRLDIISLIFGSSDHIAARIIYVVIAAASIWCVSLLFRENDVVGHRRRETYN